MGGEFQGIIEDEGGVFRPSLMVLVNGAPVDKGALPKLEEGDEVTLMAAIAGG